MNPRQYNRKITVNSLTKTIDADGIPIETWSPYYSCFAAIESMEIKAREYFQSGGIVASNLSRFHIRYKQGIQPNMRIDYSGRTFEIVSVTDVNEQHLEIHLVARELVNGD